MNTGAMLTLFAYLVSEYGNKPNKTKSVNSSVSLDNFFSFSSFY